MGLLLSVLVSYAGVLEALEFYRHIIYGLIPEGDLELNKIRLYYCDLLDKASTQNSSSLDWKSGDGNGYLSIENVKNKISASIKYYGSATDSAPLLFGTTISSFGQDSVESGDTDNERYQSRLAQTSSTETTSSEQHISDNETRVSDQAVLGSSRSFSEANAEGREKLEWHYRPLSLISSTDTHPTPEIHFETYEHSGFSVDQNSPYTEDFLRSLDGAKFRPLQRQDPSGRRRSFKKRQSSSSSTSSRASREEELKLFTSLEEAEFESNNKTAPDYNSAPNLTTNWNSNRRSRSRDKSDDSRRSNDSVDKIAEEPELTRDKTLLKDIPKLDSFDEATEAVNDNKPVSEEVLDNNNQTEADSDFWGPSSDW